LQAFFNPFHTEGALGDRIGSLTIFGYPKWTCITAILTANTLSFIVYSGSPFGFGISLSGANFHTLCIQTMHALIFQEIPAYTVYGIFMLNKANQGIGVAIGVLMSCIIALKGFHYRRKLVGVFTGY
jgi:hypothetical protein